MRVFHADTTDTVVISLLCLVYRSRAGLSDTYGRVVTSSSAVSETSTPTRGAVKRPVTSTWCPCETPTRDAVKRPVTSTWCPWSTDSDDDERTTSNSMSGTTHTSAATETARKRLVGGNAAND